MQGTYTKNTDSRFVGVPKVLFPKPGHPWMSGLGGPEGKGASRLMEGGESKHRLAFVNGPFKHSIQRLCRAVRRKHGRSAPPPRRRMQSPRGLGSHSGAETYLPGLESGTGSWQAALGTGGWQAAPGRDGSRNGFGA
jgi:hypothetical protein